MTGTETPRGRYGFPVALLVAVAQTMITAFAVGGRPGFGGYAILAGSGLVLTFRHRWPRFTVIAVAAAVLGYPGGFWFLAPIVMAVVAMRAGRSRPVWFTAGLAYAIWVFTGGARIVAVWLAGALILLEALVGIYGMVSRMAREQQRLHMERQRRRVSEERLRIAHELHDVLGHHLSLINMRAGVGLHLMDRRPEEARAALDTIKQTSAEALREVQSVIHVLYPDGQAAPRGPAPGLDRLDELTVDAGLTVRADITGSRRPLPAEVDRAAYRIVQEALTNVRRHAGPGAAATVTIEYHEELLMVEIADDGQAPADSDDGNGISGMRERARTLNGTLTAGPRPGGGWQVRASLPIPAPDAS